MSLYEQHVLPWILEWLGDMKPSRVLRRQIVPRATGTVLEIGFGTGHNFEHYDRGKVTKILALDPSSGMRKIAARRLRSLEIPCEIVPLPGEEIPLEDQSVDTVLTTFTLCTIPQVSRALREMRRVLRPAGRLVFCEHGRAPDDGVRRWQGRLNPIQKTLFGGCHLDRRIPDLIGEGGFQIEDLEAGYVPGIPKALGYVYRGTARR
ncbi:MAG: class I SAM-dependent methyltransferase [Acidobacteriota bacterium]